MSHGTRSRPSWISSYDLPCMTLTFPSSASVLSHPWGVCSQEQYQAWESRAPIASSYQANQRIHSSLHVPYLTSTVWGYRSALDPPMLHDNTRRVTFCPSLGLQGWSKPYFHSGALRQVWPVCSSAPCPPLLRCQIVSKPRWHVTLVPTLGIRLTFSSPYPFNEIVVRWDNNAPCCPNICGGLGRIAHCA